MFFCNRQEQGARMDGLSWWTETLQDYEALFKDAVGYKAVGEASPMYLHDSDAACRIKEIIPQARLICSLRDPCDRAFSQYNYHRMRGAETRTSFLEAICADQMRPHSEKRLYLEQGLYHQHIMRFLEHFPKERLKIVFFQDFRSNPQRVVREICEFLDVDPALRPKSRIRRQASGLPKYRVLSWLLNSQQNPLRRIVTSFLPSRVTALARMVKNKNLQPQSLTRAERTEILPFFRADIEALERLSGRTLRQWYDTG